MLRVREQRPAFTLIELLVVISIVAILVSLSLSAVQTGAIAPVPRFSAEIARFSA